MSALILTELRNVYVRVCVCMFVYMYVLRMYGCIHVCMYACMYGCTISMYVPVCLSVCPFTHSSLSPSFHVCLFVYLSIQPSIYLSVTLSFCLFLYPVQTSAVPTVRCCFSPLSRRGRLRCLYCCLLCRKTFF